MAMHFLFLVWYQCIIGHGEKFCPKYLDEVPLAVKMGLVLRLVREGLL